MVAQEKATTVWARSFIARAWRGLVEGLGGEAKACLKGEEVRDQGGRERRAELGTYEETKEASGGGSEGTPGTSTFVPSVIIVTSAPSLMLYPHDPPSPASPLAPPAHSTSPKLTDHNSTPT
jgi:hypothetical protein